MLGGVWVKAFYFLQFNAKKYYVYCINLGRMKRFLLIVNVLS